MRKLLGLLVLFLFACETPAPKADSKFLVVCTTGMIGDAATQLFGKSAEVKSLMGPGVDPHLYKATQGDIELLTKADIIVYNGLHLEGKMTDIFAKLAATRKVYAIGEMLPKEALINSTDYPDAHDPHIWFDVALWSEAIGGLAQQLAADFPAMSSSILSNSQNYQGLLSGLHQEVISSISQIPKAQRVLITAHDAFKYFGRAYGMEVIGLQGISTTSEYGLRDISNLVNFTTENSIKAIFVESSVPKRSVEAVIEGANSRGHQLSLGGELYSDALGSKDGPAGTYIGMVRHNLDIMVKALQ